MYAIIEIAGQQFKVQKDDEIFVHRLDGEPGKKLEFQEVLLIDDNGKIRVGKPFVEDSKITAKILEHARGDKVIVFHKKRRKGYQKAVGHRQDFTKIRIDSIATTAAPKTAKVKKEAEIKKAAPKKVAPKKAVPKKAAPKKAAPKTPAPKKVAPKKAAPKKSLVKKTTSKKATLKKAVPKKSAPKKESAEKR